MTGDWGYVECRGHFFQLVYRSMIQQMAEGERVFNKGKILVLKEFSPIDFTVSAVDHNCNIIRVDIDEECYTLKRVEKPFRLDKCVLII
jgi:hypothetical protein